MTLSGHHTMLGGVKLPYDAEVEYLESTGTQWIDTGIVPNTSTKVRLGVCNLQTTGYVILGYLTDSSGNNSWRFFSYARNVFFDMVYPNRINSNGSTAFPTGVWFDFELGNYYVKDLATGVIIVSGSYAEYTGVSSITLNHAAALNNNSRNRWRYLDIYQKDKLVQSLRAVRKDGVGEMYDRVSGTFATRYGAFVVGPDAPATTGGGYSRQCVKRSHRRSSRPSARFWCAAHSPRTWEVAA